MGNPRYEREAFDKRKEASSDEIKKRTTRAEEDTA